MQMTPHSSVETPYITKFWKLSDEQQLAFETCMNHALGNFNSQYLIFGASAGTGKSFVINALRGFLDAHSIAHTALAFTGRAASRIKARTCHSLLYEPVVDGNGDLVRWERVDPMHLKAEVGDVIIVDEASMIPYEMHLELTAIGVKIIYVGDYAQLPPVDATGNEFNVMYDIDDAVRATLVEMRRFGADSGIGEIASILREENVVKRIKRDDVRMVSKQAILSPTFFEKYHIDAILCGTNNTRKKMNSIYRKFLGHFEHDIPQVGERVMCLQNNVIGNVRINNGELYEVVYQVPGKETSKFILKEIETGKEVTVDVLNECWTTEKSPRKFRGKAVGSFAFGYATTVHKFQGSQLPSILFIDENVSYFCDPQKFRYTAVTRAEEMLYIAV